MESWNQIWASVSQISQDLMKRCPAGNTDSERQVHSKADSDPFTKNKLKWSVTIDRIIRNHCILAEYFNSYMSSSYFSFYVGKFHGKAWYEEWRNQQLSPTKLFDFYVLVSTECSSFSVLSV